MTDETRRDTVMTLDLPTDADILALRASAEATGARVLAELCDDTLDGDEVALRNVMAAIRRTQHQQTTDAPSDLDTLCAALQEDRAWRGAVLGDDGRIDWSSLPTFGGGDPREGAHRRTASMYEVWSWSPTHMLVGSHADELVVIERPEITAQRELIAALVEAATLSHSQIAELVVARDERTMRRWLAGEHRMPSSAYDALARALKAARGVLTIGVREVLEVTHEPDHATVTCALHVGVGRLTVRAHVARADGSVSLDAASLPHETLWPLALRLQSRDRVIDAIDDAVTAAAQAGSWLAS